MKKLLISLVFIVFFLSTGAQVMVKKICNLDPKLSEISGMVLVEGKLWALNDGDNPNCLFLLDTATGAVKDSTTFVNVSNTDWEEITADNHYIYIGDFGNNNGTRRDLKIYFFPLSELGKKKVKCDTINFSYADQFNFGSNVLSDFDCEAFCAANDSLFLFSKSKSTAKCRVYAIPAKKGTCVANKTDSVFLNSWVTGASLQNQKLALCAYVYFGSFAVSFFTDAEFKNGKITKPVNALAYDNILGPEQIESIVKTGDGEWLAASESIGSTPAALYKISSIKNAGNPKTETFTYQLSPNPVTDFLFIEATKVKITKVELYNSSGSTILEKICKTPLSAVEINTETLAPGRYRLVIKSGKQTAEKWIVKL